MALRRRYLEFYRDLIDSDETYMDLAIRHQKRWATYAHMTGQDRSALLLLICPEECPKDEDVKKFNILRNLLITERARYESLRN